jgi:PKHD-type hydroxylase
VLITFPLLSTEDLRRAGELLRAASWVDGRGTAGDQALQAKRNEQLPPDSDAARQLRDIVLHALERTPRFLAAALPKRIYPPMANRYSGESNRYGPHVDNAIRFADAASRVRTDLSCTVFLSDPQAYDGGELVVQEGGHARSVKLPAGHAVLYPGTSVHEVLPVTRGERLACFFWIESLVRREDQRRILLELDDALVALRTEHGENASTVSLMGTYHNLLRMWADT